MNAFDKSAEHSVHDRRSQTWDFLQIVQGISVRVIKDQFPAIEHIWLIEGCSAGPPRSPYLTLQTKMLRQHSH